MSDVREYELALLVRPELTEDAVNEVVSKVNSIIESQGGTPKPPSLWGKRRLAYEINELHEASYVFVEFSGAPGLPQELTRQLRFDETVVRHMVVKAIPKPENAKEEEQETEAPPQQEPTLVRETEGTDV